jgi:hypothetical protein
MAVDAVGVVAVAVPVARVATSAESIDLDLLALRPARLRGGIVGAGSTFTVRAWRPTAECDLIAGWAAESAMVTILAGRRCQSSWVSLGVGRRRTLLDEALTTLTVGRS